MSLTDRTLRTSHDELPQVRSRRRWMLPTAGAVLLLAGCTIAGVSLLGNNDEPAQAAPPATTAPSAQEVQAAKDAAWQSVQTWNDRTLQAESVNSLSGVDLASIALPGAIENEQRVIEGAVQAGVRSEGGSSLQLLSSDYSAEAPNAFAPARVKLSVCVDSSQAKVLDQAGNNMRVGPDGSSSFPTRLVSTFWAYEKDGAWLVDGGTRTEQSC